VLLAGLSTGHTIGLSIVAVLFIAFALASSFLVPRRWPDYPGKTGIGIFAVVCVLLFAAQLTSVWVFGAESEAKGAEATAGAQGASASSHTIKVQETEFKIQLPTLKTLAPGKYTFDVTNAGKIPHDLAIEGGKIAGPSKTPTIAAGKTAMLTVSLEKGSYTLYCSVPGHRALGMVAKLAVQ
jgi:plastocyanin